MNDRVDFEVLQPTQRSRYYGMTPLPDETTFSFVERAALLTGATCSKQVARELFGSISLLGRPAAKVHGGFGQFASHFAGLKGGDLDTLLDSVSFLPLFEPFLTNVQFSLLRERCCESNAHGLGVAARITRPGLFRRYPAICPECLIADKLTFKVGYYHRVPQITAVTVCPEHGHKLISHCPACGARLPKIPEISCSACGCNFGEHGSSQEPLNDASLRLARFAEACFSQAMPVLDTATRLAVLQSRAKERIKNRSGVVGDNLAIHLNRIYGRNFLGSLGLATDSDDTIGWPSLVINGRAWIYEVAPQLLLISALFDSVEDFCNASHRRPRSTPKQEVSPRRIELLWSREIFYDLIRFRDVELIAERYEVAESVVEKWVDVYPGLRARLECSKGRH